MIEGKPETALRAYLREVLQANQRFNLTAIRDENAAWNRHILDSLAALSTPLFDGDARVIDIGSGAGFPGVVLAIARPKLQVTLLEATRKKCEFLQAATLVHAPSVGVLNARAEDAGHDPNLRESFDVATARAVGSLSEVLELGLPLVRVGGAVLLWRGPNASQEIVHAKSALQLLHARAAVLHSYPLPDSEPEFHLVRVEKLKNTPKSYPRRAGIPKHSPL